MAEVTWIKGTIDPPQSGEYYVTLEAKQDIINPVTGQVYYKTGADKQLIFRSNQMVYGFRKVSDTIDVRCILGCCNVYNESHD